MKWSSLSIIRPDYRAGMTLQIFLFSRAVPLSFDQCLIGEPPIYLLGWRQVYRRSVFMQMTVLPLP